MKKHTVRYKTEIDKRKAQMCTETSTSTHASRHTCTLLVYLLHILPHVRTYWCTVYCISFSVKGRPVKKPYTRTNSGLPTVASLLLCITAIVRV